MAMVDLKGVYIVTSKGSTYHYAWRGKGAPRLRSVPGSPAYVEELSVALSARTGGDKTKLSGLCATYRASDEWKALSAKTRSDWARWLDKIQVRFGSMPIRALDAPKVRIPIRKWRDQYKEHPRAADMGLQVFSRLCSFAVAEGEIRANPIAGIPRLYASNRSEMIWTPLDLSEMGKHASAEVMLAARLAALTGLRKADLLRLSWSHVGALAIEIRTGKSREKKTTLIPIYAELRALLDSIPKRSTTVLVNTFGRPWKTGFGASWNTAIRKTALQLHFHDLRGTFATRIYLAGMTIREIAEILTWSEDKVERLIDRYVKRDELLLARIRKIDESKAGTDSAKLGEKLS